MYTVKTFLPYYLFKICHYLLIIGNVFIDAEFYTNVPKNKPDNMLISLLLSKKRPTTVTSMVVPTC